MSKRTIWLAILLTAITLCLCSQQALALTETMVTMAGGGVFPPTTTYGAYSLTSLRYGAGVSVFSDGTAAGDLDITVLGSQAGLPRTITLEGKAASGSVPRAGTVTFSGVCNVDMGDGNPPYSGILFSVTVVSSKQTLQLTIGSTTLSIATSTKGRITIQ